MSNLAKPLVPIALAFVVAVSPLYSPDAAVAQSSGFETVRDHLYDRVSRDTWRILVHSNNDHAHRFAEVV